MLRGRVFVRQGPVSRRKWGSTDKVEDVRHDYVMVGVFEMDEDSAYEQSLIRPFLADFVQGTLRIGFQHGTLPPSPEHRECDMGDLALQPVWPRPAPETGMGGGGLMLRDTRAPSAPGTRIMTGIMVMSLHGGPPDASIIDLEGDVGGWPGSEGSRSGYILSTGVDSSKPGYMNGMPLNSILKEPIWGWGDEPFAFMSTMDLEVIDQCERFDRIRRSVEGKDPDSIDGATRVELLSLKKSSLSWIVSSSDKDEKFQIFKRKMTERGLITRRDGVRTASEEAAFSNAAREVLIEMETEEDEADYASRWAA
jgi:hypothetical protein